MRPLSFWVFGVSLLGAMGVLAGCQSKPPEFATEIPTSRVRELATGSSAPVGSLAISPDGKTLFVGREDGSSLDSFDFETGKKLHTFAGYGPFALAISPDGKILAAPSAGGSTEGTVGLWDAVTGKEVGSLDTGEAARELAFSADSKKLLVAIGYNGLRIQLWGARTGKQEREYGDEDSGAAGAVAFCGDGKSILAVGYKAAVLDLTSGKVTRRVDVGNGNFAAISRDQSHALIGNIGSSGVGLLELASGKITGFAPLQGEYAETVSFDFSPDGKRFVCGDRDGAVRVWNVQTGDLMHMLRLQDDLRAVLFSPDGGQIVAAGTSGRIIVWTPPAEQCATGGAAVNPVGHARDAARPIVEIPFSSPVSSMALSQDGVTLFIGWGRGRLESFDLKTGKKLQSFAGYSENVGRLALSPDGKTLASASCFGAVKLWSADSGKLIRAIGEETGYVTALAFTPDGGKLLSCCADRVPEALLYDVEKGGYEQVYRGHFVDVAFSKDGKSFLTASPCGEVTVWDRQTSKESHRQFDIGDVETTFLGLKFAGAVSPDQSRVLLAVDGDVKLLDLATGKVCRTFSPGKGSHEKVMSLAFSPDGRRFVAGGFAWGDNRGVVRVWNVQTGDLALTLRPEGAVQTVLFSRDGNQIVAGGDGNKVAVWQLAAEPAMAPDSATKATKGVNRGAVLHPYPSVR